MAIRLCRLCLRRSQETLPLFKARIGDILLTEMIWSTFRVEFDKNAFFPRNVCASCIKKVDYLYSFQQELMKCQSVLFECKNKGKITAKDLKSLNLPYYSDGISEPAQVLEEQNDECASMEIEQLDQDMDVEKVDNDEYQSAILVDEPIFEEQLIDIKIETLETGDRFEVEQIIGNYDALSKYCSDAEEDFKGFEEPVPVRLEAAEGFQPDKTQKRLKAVPKLDIIETIPNKCYICNTIYENNDLFDIHLVSHKIMLPYNCVKCSTRVNPIEIKTLVQLNKHFESHGFSYECSHCPLRFRSYPPLYDHTRNAHSRNTEGFTCDICGQVFNEIRKFQKHTRAHKAREMQRYKCKTCNKTFQTGTLLRRHEQIHADNRPFVCPYCNRGFNHESNFRQHKMRHIQQQCEDESGYPCTVCKKHYTNATDLRVHMREHFPNDPMYTTKTDILPKKLKDSSSYPRPCEEADCHYVAPSYQLMWSHYRNHYKMYQCQQCDNKFATATILKRHIEVIHQNIRKYKCELCPKAFGYQHKYKEHMNMHSGVKAYQCRYCQKSFTHSSNLLVHQRIHTKIKPHKCLTCGTSYVTTSALKKHQKTHLPKQLVAGTVQTVSKNSKQQIYAETEFIFGVNCEEHDIAGEEEVDLNYLE
ncbi:zinc finger protein 878-like isoform X2 [Topomyia yanbarensis]|uniref:zinc finger protein 878-like isoform X2 n=1 Tax=Topomyia yanbarensis TaxID=2498891 RepID=UPI00273B0B14|nr:zinc finger protein 878-like isoform X2 [Topomyia yanbarensis]